jgi:hypothetical protein
MAIKIATSLPNQLDYKAMYERATAENKRLAAAIGAMETKPAKVSKAKIAVTLRLTQQCASYFQSRHGDDWRLEMQKALEAMAGP